MADNNTDTKVQIKDRSLCTSSTQLREDFKSIFFSAMFICTQLRIFLQSQEMKSLISRQDQIRIFNKGRDQKELLEPYSRLWYSARFKEKLPRLIDKKSCSQIDKAVVEYFNEDGRMVFDRDKKSLYIVCDSSFKDFSTAQYEQLHDLAKEAVEITILSKTDIVENIGHCNVAESFRFESILHYLHETSVQERSYEQDMEELCTLQYGYRPKKKPTDPLVFKVPEDQPKHFTSMKSLSPTFPSISLELKSLGAT